MVGFATVPQRPSWVFDPIGYLRSKRLLAPNAKIKKNRASADPIARAALRQGIPLKR